LDIIKPEDHFYDLCCGSGAISIELINRGFDPSRIVMLDSSPWGLFWYHVGYGIFNLDKFKNFLLEIPENKYEIPLYMKQLFLQKPKEEDIVYLFPILQASTFGGASVWLSPQGEWRKGGGFRSFWQPKKEGQHATNPMMPMPDTLYGRVSKICHEMRGVCGLHRDIKNFFPAHGGKVYIDPAYEGTHQYGNSFNIFEIVNDLKHLNVEIFVSEAKPLSDISWKISEEIKGGMHGAAKTKREEWLSYM
jgi:hypothetical protein